MNETTLFESSSQKNNEKNKHSQNNNSSQQGPPTPVPVNSVGNSSLPPGLQTEALLSYSPLNLNKDGNTMETL